MKKRTVIACSPLYYSGPYSTLLACGHTRATKVRHDVGARVICTQCTRKSRGEYVRYDAERKAPR